MSLPDTLPAVDEQTVYRIPVENWVAFTTKFARLVKTATKLGVEVPAFTDLGTELVPQSVSETGVPVGLTEVKLITVTGAAPVLAGWRLDAVVDLTGPATVVHAKTDDIDRSWWKIDEGYCDHCNVKTRRNMVFVVSDTGGDRKVVGSTCIRDFLGHGSPEAIAALAELIFETDDFMGEFLEGGTGGPTHLPTVEILTLAAAIVEEFGWKAKSDPRPGSPTASIVNDYLFGKSEECKQLRENIAITAANRAEAAAIIAWGSALTDDEAFKSDYLANLRALLSVEAITVAQLGLTVSAVSAYQRHLGWEADRKLQAEAEAGVVSEHFGKVKERLVVTATVLTSKLLDGDYGVRNLVKARTDDGNVVVWWASGNQHLDVGDRITGKATVKSHGEFNGVPETVVNRWDFSSMEEGETAEAAATRIAAEAKAAKAARKIKEAEWEAQRIEQERVSKERAELHRLFAFLQAPHTFFSDEEAAAIRKADQHRRRLMDVLASSLFPKYGRWFR